MQHMPDNDFDNLFRDKFMNAEVEPSANLWASIEGQLVTKRKRKFPFMWVAAASVVVVASAIMFTQSGEKIYLQSSTTDVAAVQPVVEQPVSTVVATAADLAPTATPTVHRVASRNLATREVPAEAVAQLVDDQKNIIASVQPSASNEHLPIKRAEVKALDVTNTANVVPVVNTASDSNNGSMMANLGNLADDDAPEQAVETNKKGIRNMGDLINYVVEKVDKREKKLIKFNTDDDDNSSIIGLNIGFVKLNKKNNK
jgi:hypothetical protein